MFAVYPEWFVITSLKRWNTRKCSPDVKVTDLSHQSHIFNVSVLLDYTGHFVMPKRTRRTVCNVIRHCYRIHANKAHLSMVTIIHHIKVTWIRACILLFARSVNGRYKCKYLFIYLHLCRLLGEHAYMQHWSCSGVDEASFYCDLHTPGFKNDLTLKTMHSYERNYVINYHLNQLKSPEILTLSEGFHPALFKLFFRKSLVWYNYTRIHE